MLQHRMDTAQDLMLMATNQMLKRSRSIEQTKETLEDLQNNRYFSGIFDKQEMNSQEGNRTKIAST